MTYTDLSQALFQFWSQFVWDGKPIPAFLQGHVPDDEDIKEMYGRVYPFITYSVGMGDFDGTSVQVAHVWCRQEPGMNVNAQRATIVDQIGQQIPAHVGRVFPLVNGGGMWLMRNVDFATNYTPQKDTTTEVEGEPVISGRISYLIKSY